MQTKSSWMLRQLATFTGESVMKKMILVASAIAAAFTAAMVLAAPQASATDGAESRAPNRAAAYLLASAD